MSQRFNPDENQWKDLHFSMKKLDLNKIGYSHHSAKKEVEKKIETLGLPKVVAAKPIARMLGEVFDRMNGLLDNGFANFFEEMQDAQKKSKYKQSIVCDDIIEFYQRTNNIVGTYGYRCGKPVNQLEEKFENFLQILEQGDKNNITTFMESYFVADFIWDFDSADLSDDLLDDIIETCSTSGIMNPLLAIFISSITHENGSTHFKYFLEKYYDKYNLNKEHAAELVNYFNKNKDHMLNCISSTVLKYLKIHKHILKKSIECTCRYSKHFGCDDRMYAKFVYKPSKYNSNYQMKRELEDVNIKPDFKACKLHFMTSKIIANMDLNDLYYDNEKNFLLDAVDAIIFSTDRKALTYLSAESIFYYFLTKICQRMCELTTKFLRIENLNILNSDIKCPSDGDKWTTNDRFDFKSFLAFCQVPSDIFLNDVERPADNSFPNIFRDNDLNEEEEEEKEKKRIKRHKFLNEINYQGDDERVKYLVELIKSHIEPKVYY